MQTNFSLVFLGQKTKSHLWTIAIKMVFSREMKTKNIVTTRKVALNDTLEDTTNDNGNDENSCYRKEIFQHLLTKQRYSQL